MVNGNAHQMLLVAMKCTISKSTTICQTGNAQKVIQCAKCQMTSTAHQMIQIAKTGTTGVVLKTIQNALHHQNGVKCQVTGNVIATQLMIQIACVTLVCMTPLVAATATHKIQTACVMTIWEVMVEILQEVTTLQEVILMHHLCEHTFPSSMLEPIEISTVITILTFNMNISNKLTMYLI